MVNPRQVVRAIVFASLLSVLSAASVSLANGQDDFSLTPEPLHPPKVDPGGSSIATIVLAAIGTFDSPVSLSCAVTSNQITDNLPQCAVSPDSATPNALPALTITTSGAAAPTGATSAGLYTITVTGTSGSLTHTATLALNVVDLTENYTLSVSPTTAVPNPVAAGSAATTTVTVTPIGSYAGQVTLSCLSVSQTVELAPVCSFNPATVAVTNSSIPPTSVLTLTTTGPAPTTRLWNRRFFYALWLALPGLVMVGVGATGARRKNPLGALLLMAVASGLLLLPACNAARSLGSNGNTPSNTYTFTLAGADVNGAAPSNTTATTVTLTVK